MRNIVNTIVSPNICRAAAAGVLLLTICASAINSYAETDEYGNVIAEIPGRRTQTEYVVISSGKKYILTADEISGGTDNLSDDDTLNYVSTPVESSLMTMTGSFAAYDTPVCDCIASSGEWEPVGDAYGSGGWRFLSTDGETYAADCWLYIGDGYSYLTRDGYWYYFDEDGFMKSGWFGNADNLYYLSERHDGSFGKMKTGWHKDDDGYIYYFDYYTGNMLTGWQKIDSYWYYFTPVDDTACEADGDGGSSVQLIYTDETGSRPCGSMYRNEYTPDGWYADNLGRAFDHEVEYAF